MPSGYGHSFGRRSGLEPIWTGFVKTLLAVSGQNIAITAIGVVTVAPSVVRAAVSGVLASLAWIVARPRDRWHALAVGALVLLAWDADFRAQI